MDIAIVYDKNQSYTTGIYCRQALESLGHRVRFYDRKARIYRAYDLVIKVDDGTYNSFKVMPWHRTIFWAIDTHTNMDRLCRIANRADYLFCAQKNGVSLFKERGFNATWLPLAGEIEKSRDKGELKYDIAFIGGVHTEKRKRQEILIKKLSKKVYFGPARQQEISHIYSNSYIGFNTIVNNDINMRTFEITINGALLLMERVHDNGMGELFVEGQEYIAYEGEDDLTAKVQSILENKAKYEPIRLAGHKRALEQHTYRKRMERLITQAFR